jgi:ABC-type sugar transport system ATPase subunit
MNHPPGAASLDIPALETRKLTKSYLGVVALNGFDFSLAPGEVRALLGKNGAGKSTFSEMISGTIAPTSGEIRIAGVAAELRSPSDARDRGIATVHQDLRLFPELTVRENITLAQRARFGIVSRKRQVAEAERALGLLGVPIGLERRVKDLSNRDQQLVAIARALLHDPRVLILDEPTSALHEREIDQLIGVVRRLAGQGVSTVYVSHRLDEIPRVADSVTVVRDGELAGTLPMARASASEIVEMMLGRNLDQVERPASVAASVVALSADNLKSRKLHGISFTLREGEVLGLWGMPGAGRTELMRVLYGLNPARSGTVAVFGSRSRGGGPQASIKLGMGLSPSDRKRQGLVQSMSVAENLVMACPQRISRFGIVSALRRRRVSQTEVDRFAIKIPHLDAPAQTLSGGNQQKVVLGKWLAAGARILLLDEPTQGVDVEAKAAIYALLRALAASGVSTLIAPTELQELFLVCDRILVLRRGSIVGVLETAATTGHAVMQLAMGG